MNSRTTTGKTSARNPKVKPVAQGCEYVSDQQLAARYSVHRATIWRWVQAGRLPAPIELSPGCTRWQLSAIEQLDAARAAP